VHHLGLQPFVQVRDAASVDDDGTGGAAQAAETLAFTIEDHQRTVCTLQKKIRKIPFGCSDGDLHPYVPRQRADRADVAVEPLLQVAVFDELVQEHPVNAVLCRH